MNMEKMLEYVMRGAEIGLILGREVPKMVEDGKITLDEMVALTRTVAAVGDWKLEFNLPDEVMGVEIGVKEG